MTDMILLTDAEIAAVAGGAIGQGINITATQQNSSTVNQTASATNTGAVTATASGTNSVAAAVGASASNFADVSQANILAATNSGRFGRHL
jgi:hypothetical protein